MRPPLFSALVLLSLLAACAQHGGYRVTASDYARAESFLPAQTRPLVDGLLSEPLWLPDGRLLYRHRIEGGSEILAADPATGRIEPAFDHDRVAAALAAASEEDVEAADLPRMRLEDGAPVFTIGGTPYRCDLGTLAVTALPRPERNVVLSPDGRRAAFRRDHDLWVRDVASGAETRLTTDGSEHYGYATNNAGWTKGDGPVLLWSPDSQRIATFRHDSREVGDMYLVSTKVGHPELEAWKYPLPGDEHIFMIERVVVHLDGDAPRVVPLKMPPDAHRSTTSDHVAGRGGRFLDVEWSADSRQLLFISSSRDHQQARLRLADPDTGEVREVLYEVEDTFFESGVDGSCWRLLADTGEVLWWSQRDGWGHLYLFDLETGEQKRQLTSGDWVVRDLLRVDREQRALYVVGAGREPGDPYFQYLYRVSLDGGEPELLTPDAGHHSVSLAPGGSHFVDTCSTPTRPPVSVLRRMDGTAVQELARADIRRLEASGWRPPIPFTVKARDGETDLHGLMYRPTTFDPARSYPILNYLYPGPQSGSVGSRGFQASRRDKQAVAELGFVVVEVDAMGTPGRSKSFHDAYYGNMGDNGLPDQMAAIRQLAGRHDWMDLGRVGIWGHSGGGFASTDAILRYPDFYHVAVSSAGNHDNRNYEDDWGEKWQGLLVENEDGSTNYDNQANQLLAGNLKGRLLIAHGLMDSNVPPSNTLLVVQALIEANKDFDLLLFPEARHGFGNTPYMMRRRWDYFVRHLHGVEPPREYPLDG